MPPEQWSGQPVPASDQYSLAVLAYSLLTGRLPFYGRLEQVMYQHINIRPQPPSNLNPTLPNEIDTVILKALEKRPADRFPSVVAFAQALQQATRNGDGLTIPMQRRVIELQQHQYDETAPAMQHPPLSTFTPARHISDLPIQRRSSSMKIPLFIGLVLLILAGSVGYVFVRGTTSTTSSHALSASTPTTGTSVTSALTSTTGSQISPTTSSLSVTYPPPNATLIISDPLSDNSKGYQWETKPDSGGVCAFTGGAYQVTETSLQTVEYCPAYQTDIHDNFVYEVQMSIVQGDVGGLLFRDNTDGKSYYFRCSAGGYYTLAYYADNAPDRKDILQGSTPALNTGYNQSNLLAVKVQGGNISLYANRQLIDQIDVGTYGDGYIGVFANDKTNPTVVIYNNAKVWSF
jgi:eukaryotic-like serine/threonine-protein kinase